MVMTNAITEKSIKLKDIKFDTNIYPRKTHDPSLVQKYFDCLEQIEAKHNYIAVSEDMTLLDGRHRHLAYLKKYENDGQDADLTVFVYPVISDQDKFAKSIELNNAHGCQLSDKDKARCAEDLFLKYHYSLDEIARQISVRKARVTEWTKALREAEEKRQNETIFDMYLACYTEDEIAEKVGISHDSVGRKIEDLRKSFPGTNSVKLSQYDDPDFQVPLYTVWSFGRKTNEVNHFGNSEQRILDNLLYLYTKPYDIILDPFAGGGATVDVCKNRLRRYFVSDRKPITERKDDIRLLDICKELPGLNRRWSEVTLTYLDPPYWKQAEGKYSKDSDDLANMSLEDFTVKLSGVIKAISEKQSKGVIAMLMQPTQWNAPGREIQDHVIDLINAVGNKRLKLEYRISCPYSSEQCTPQQVIWAKENKKLLVISRELIIWRLNG
jgi:predicted DNA-binding protein YlxM (UPF0122 family)